MLEHLANSSFVAMVKSLQDILTHSSAFFPLFSRPSNAKSKSPEYISAKCFYNRHHTSMSSGSSTKTNTHSASGKIHFIMYDPYIFRFYFVEFCKKCYCHTGVIHEGLRLNKNHFLNMSMVIVPFYVCNI